MAEWIKRKSEVVAVESNCIEVSELMEEVSGKEMTTNNTNHLIDIVQTGSLRSQLEVRPLKIFDHLGDLRQDGCPRTPRLSEGAWSIGATDG